MEALNDILGGAFSSRLNLNLRENKGYTYGIGSSFIYRTHPGYWAAGGAVRTDVTRESLVEFMKEIRAIDTDRPPTEAELAEAKTRLIRGYALHFQTNGGVAGQIAEALALGLPLDTLGRYDAGINAVTVDHLRQAAHKYLDPSKLVILVVGDLGKIEPGVRSMNLGKLEVVDAEGKPAGR